MKDKFWLIQRGKFNNNIDKATSFLGGRSECLINPDYMGAAEFEWGAIPKAYRRIMGQYDQYSLHVTDLVTTGGVPFCLYCRDDRYEVILNAIKVYLNEHYQLKEWSNMHAHFEPTPTSEWSRKHHKYELQTNFWWCIDVSPIECKREWDNPVGDWIAFTGASDRQNAFNRVLNLDYMTWWMKKSEDERKKDFEESFLRR